MDHIYSTLSNIKSLSINNLMKTVGIDPAVFSKLKLGEIKPTTNYLRRIQKAVCDLHDVLIDLTEGNPLTLQESHGELFKRPLAHLSHDDIDLMIQSLDDLDNYITRKIGLNKRAPSIDDMLSDGAAAAPSPDRQSDDPSLMLAHDDTTDPIEDESENSEVNSLMLLDRDDKESERSLQDKVESAPKDTNQFTQLQPIESPSTLATPQKKTSAFKNNSSINDRIISFLNTPA